MARFIRKLSVYLALMLLLPGLIIYLFILAYPAYFLGNPIDYYICKFQYTRIDTSTYRNIIIGDSRGNASVDPRYLGPSWINLSVPGIDFFEGFYTVKHHLQRTRIDTVVMIYGLDYAIEGTRFFNFRTIPFQFNTPKELQDLDLLEKKFGFAYHDSSVVGQQHLLTYQLSRKLRYHHFPFFYREHFLDGLNTLLRTRSSTEKRSREIETQLQEQLGHINFGMADSSNIIFGGPPDRAVRPNPINLAYLDSTMSLAARNNIVLYLVIAPMNRASFTAYKNTPVQKSVDVFFNALTAKYPQMHLVRAPEFLENSFFGDAQHLNPRGTMLYSASLRQLLSKGLAR